MSDQFSHWPDLSSGCQHHVVGGLQSHEWPEAIRIRRAGQVPHEPVSKETKNIKKLQAWRVLQGNLGERAYPLLVCPACSLPLPGIKEEGQVPVVELLPDAGIAQAVGYKLCVPFIASKGSADRCNEGQR